MAFLAVLDLIGLADIKAKGRIKLQRISARCRFRVAEHDTDFHPDLVDEYQDGIAAIENTGEFPHGLRHESGLQADVGVTDIAVNFGPRDQGRNRVDDNHVDSA